MPRPVRQSAHPYDVAAATMQLHGLLQNRGVSACGVCPGLTGSVDGEEVPSGGPGSGVLVPAGYAGVAAGGASGGAGGHGGGGGCGDAGGSPRAADGGGGGGGGGAAAVPVAWGAAGEG